MLSKSDVMAFIATRDSERSCAFYRDVLGLRFVADEPYALVFDASGTMLRVQKVQELVPATHTALGFRVADVRAVIRNLKSRGVSMERFGFMDQDDFGVWTAAGGAQIAWFKDPDGNLLSLTQF